MFKDWLKAMRKQWSWNNDRVSWYICLVLALLHTLVYHFFGEIVVTPEDMYIQAMFFLYFVMFGSLLVCYHSIKLVLFSMFLWLVVHMKNKGDSKAAEVYEEAMVWRQ